MTVQTPAADAAETRTGFICALTAYGMWGVLPAFFKLMETVRPDFVVSHRIVWSVIFVSLFLLAVGRFSEVMEIVRQPKLVRNLCISTLLIVGNWLVFVWAVSNHQVLEVSLGYFINPLVSVVLALVVLREKISRFQGLAIGLAAVGVVLQAIIAGGLPWVSLFLAASFAGYGYMRKITPVRATPGLLIETVLLLPFVLGYLAINWVNGVEVFPTDEPVVMAALIASGALTAVPLVLFSAGARRLPLVMIGILQYIAPSMHFLQAVFIWGEPLHMGTLTTFLIIWAALAIFSYDSLKRWRRQRLGPVPTV
ncbi:EamA family transporter RarD [Roseibium limicola]|uniref:EamA family transporter RarD n=1 Tax=Roseibium limicola TaxID=2816037 RepID=A0A939JA63_9HYPH|nr:EamA family transporter RarD [Roseibium limicola]MBO0346118.1 EamA family transporter RarD [Roseibium limicola]